MSKKSEQIATMIQSFQGQALDAHYLAFFECFNRGQFYEAHDVLEELWLPSRKGPYDQFYKGLIQLAGAFVHLKKERLRPAVALFKLSRTNLETYPRCFQQINLDQALLLIDTWINRLEVCKFHRNPLHEHNPPQLTPPQALPAC